VGDRFIVVGLGQILWDLLPGGKKLGGAPANFAFHAAALGDRGTVASRVGDDPPGREILDRLRELGKVHSALQVDPLHPTGTVEVRLDGRGQPSYTITPDVAWDYLEWDEPLEMLARQTDAVCFGTLAQRSPRSRGTILRFLDATRPQALRIFDINLRQSYYDRESVDRSLRASRVLKLNHEELPAVLRLLGLPVPADPRAGCRRIRREHDLDLVCLTRGERGSLLVGENGEAGHPGFPVPVVDTVGSGDAFTAALVHHLLRGSPLPRIAEAANCYGAWVATQAGATPTPPAEVLARAR
jgi:fructokinase